MKVASVSGLTNVGKSLKLWLISVWGKLSSLHLSGHSTSPLWIKSYQNNSKTLYIKAQAKVFLSVFFPVSFLHWCSHTMFFLLLLIPLPPVFVSFTSLLNSPPPPLCQSLPPLLSSGLLTCLYVSCPLWNSPLCHILFSSFYPVWIQFPPPWTAESRYWRKWVHAGCWLMGYSGLAVEGNRAK